MNNQKFKKLINKLDKITYNPYSVKNLIKSIIINEFKYNINFKNGFDKYINLIIKNNIVPHVLNSLKYHMIRCEQSYLNFLIDVKRCDYININESINKFIFNINQLINKHILNDSFFLE